MRAWMLAVAVLAFGMLRVEVAVAEPPPGEMRVWTDVSGQETEGAIMGASEEAIEMRGTTGRSYTIPMSRLSFADQVYVEEWKAGRGSVGKKSDLPRIRFFGCESRGQKVVFVVDASASMAAKGAAGKTKADLMKEELTKAVEALPAGIEFQILFFSGPAWFVGEDVERESKGWKQLDGKNFWHYKDGKDSSLRVGLYRVASPSTISKTVQEIEDTPMTFGTDWREPLKMAILMKPDVIYFMTDGAIGAHPTKPPVVEEVLAFNLANAQALINSICLMVPHASDLLIELARETGGEFSLVLEDGSVKYGFEVE